MKQKLVCALLCFALMLPLHLLRHPLVDISVSSPSPTKLEQGIGRKILKEKAEIIDGEKESEIEVSSVGIEHKYEEEGGGIYSADYSVVTTHSLPLPKHHPKP
ncbi:hypothetical protein Cni_G05036 [Canna indica]|uniref:Uncharacterized protein n=1 Tax=Canna indica TaxID=4628 RepID=A0AAQ3JWB6_9LILI|nr:hypothetical protein Cni_G05036 [Canna indica]